MKPLDFYCLGIELSEDAHTEARQRTVVNRLYYGLHHEACCRLFREHPSPPSQPLNRNRRHTDLSYRFRELNESHSTEVAQLLVTLSRLRSESDYQLTPPLRHRNRSYQPVQVMELAIGFARQLLEALDGYSEGEAPDGCNCPEAYSSR